MTRILIADDHTIVRKGLKQILSEGMVDCDFSEASNASEVAAQISRSTFDIVILDVSMPGRTGLEVLKDIKIVQPDLPVLILSMHPEDQYALRVLKAGAMGYMTKDSAPEQLVDAVKKILHGGKYVSPEFSEKLLSFIYSPQHGEGYQILSDREFEVLKLIGSGKTASEIAAILSLSVKTVSTYRTRILDKLHLSTTAELTRYALEQKIIE